ncbi:MAG TPA: capsule assembly Wzi family protein [Steroidobacteraceae bacterium]|nr:capsule assembly Wzi family protein [Steroidobacteraceae bacterium]
MQYYREMTKAGRYIPLLLLAIPSVSPARGASPYLPLNLQPEVERQIERVLILAGKPILRRPIAAATVLDALPKACAVDPQLCAVVSAILQRYMPPFSITNVSLEGASGDSTGKTLPNRYGLDTSSSWNAAASVLWEPTDHLLLNVGGVAYEGRAVPEGTMLSFGWDTAQVDVGWRSHWLSPLTDSAMLVSTEAATMPSVTLSNYTPLTPLGLGYEFFVAQMSKSDLIATDAGYTSGNPRIMGLQLTMEPVSGWALGLNRIMQYGGGTRDSSFGSAWQAFFNPSGKDNTTLGPDAQFGNQLGSITSQFIFPGKLPFAVYFEYGGEDTSRGNNLLLGNSSLSAGINFPRLGHGLDLTLEASEWQNAWYVHGIYGDGLTNYGHVIGHWGGDERQFGDGVGAQTEMMRVGWEPGFGGLLQLQLRTIENQSYSGVPYQRGYDASLRYSRTWKEFTLGGEGFAGRDVFGNNFQWFGAFVRYAQDGASAGLLADLTESSHTDDPSAQVFVDAGMNANKVSVNPTENSVTTTGALNYSPHLAIGARRAVTAHGDLGARLELDRIDDHLLLAVRAVDYRYRFASPFALSGFLGAARYDLDTPAYGIYGGVGGQWRDIVKNWDLGMDLRFAWNVARDHLLPSDPQSVRPDSFYDIASATLYVSRRF